MTGKSTAARHCEERSNPEKNLENKNKNRCALVPSIKKSKQFPKIFASESRYIGKVKKIC